jgi:hypothetical protein
MDIEHKGMRSFSRRVHMKKMTTGSLAVMLALGSGGSLLAHHSLTNYDTTKPIRVIGTIVEFRNQPAQFYLCE